LKKQYEMCWSIISQCNKNAIMTGFRPLKNA
jgi:hypothetical protein